MERIRALVEEMRADLPPDEREALVQRLAVPLWRIRDVAELYNISYSTVYGWVKKGLIRATEILGVFYIVPESALGQTVGQGHRPRILTEEQVRAIRAEVREDTQAVVAQRYNISESLVCRILKGERYGDVV